MLTELGSLPRVIYSHYTANGENPLLSYTHECLMLIFSDIHK